MIAYCGLNCQTCPIYLATGEEDPEAQMRMRAEIARVCNKQYSLDYEPGDISDCDGCRSEEGQIFSACRDCPIRDCARQKQLENCAYCDEYACQKLETFFASESGARAHLDELRKDIQ